MNSQTEILHTPLYSRHVALGARMVPFAGYLMPVSYAGIREEHQAVRTACGLFDTSHMGLIRVSGPEALAWLDSVLVSDVSSLAVGKAQYSAICYENGTLVDDIYVLRPAAEDWFLVVNASNKTKDHQWLKQHAGQGISLVPMVELGILALQGPAAPALASSLLGPEVLSLTRNGSGWFRYRNAPLLVSRTGYTGEDGFEFYPENTMLGLLWDTLLAQGKPQGIVPVGLGARDTLRLEAGFSLYGHELNDKATLLESGLAWVAAWNKADFVGKSALDLQKQAGVPRRIVGLKAVDKCIPREGYPVWDGGRMVGHITSGGVIPTTGEGVAMALVAADSCKLGAGADVEIRGQHKQFIVCSRRFLRKDAAQA